MTGLFRAIADTIAPPDLTCAVCGGERDVLCGFGICRACAKTLRPLNETVCVAPNVEAISAFVYEENAAKLVHDLKYGAKGHAAYALGAFMAARCEDLKRSDFVVVPVSMHPRRYLSRGFNQSVYLAREVSSRLSLPVCSALCKTRNTPHQTGLDAKSRNENLTDSWRVKDRAAERIKGRPVLLIDDVRTTGATIRTCAKALLSAGASRVLALTAAGTQKDAERREAFENEAFFRENNPKQDKS